MDRGHCAGISGAKKVITGLFSGVALQNQELINSRTKAALQAKKAQGAKPRKPENFTSDKPFAKTK